MEPIKIRLLKNNISLLLLTFIAPIFILLFVLYQQYQSLSIIHFGDIPTTALMIIEAFILSLFVFLASRTFVFLIKNKPSLIFTEEEIVSNGLFSTFIIHWYEFESYTNAFVDTQSISQYFISLKLSPSSPYIKNASYIRKYLNNYNLKRASGEVAFSPTVLGDEYANVANLINRKVPIK
ncbi:MAG: hypothetical protein ACRC6T_07635 [Sarcina sp.]